MSKVEPKQVRMPKDMFCVERVNRALQLLLEHTDIEIKAQEQKAQEAGQKDYILFDLRNKQ